jgi:hypothetical protein
VGAGGNEKTENGNTMEEVGRNMGRPVENLPDRIEIKQLKNHHRAMARDIIAMGEIRNRDLARIYNMTEGQISIITNSPVFLAELARLETEVEENICDVREGIRLLVPRAEQVLKEELFKDDDPLVNKVLSLQERKLRLGVALDVLDRDSGKKKHGESAAKSLHFHQHNELHVGEMSTVDLQRDVFKLVTED